MRIFIIMSFLNTVFISVITINNIMNEHYEKYKETIKKVARRNYRKRIVLQIFSADKSCVTVPVKPYAVPHPHDSEIRKLIRECQIMRVEEKYFT